MEPDFSACSLQPYIFFSSSSSFSLYCLPLCWPPSINNRAIIHTSLDCLNLRSIARTFRVSIATVILELSASVCACFVVRCNKRSALVDRCKYDDIDQRQLDFRQKCCKMKAIFDTSETQLQISHRYAKNSNVCVCARACASVCMVREREKKHRNKK